MTAFALRPLPPEAEKLCRLLSAPPRLITHLTLVHDAACDLVVGVQQKFPTLAFDRVAVLFGAATHDLGSRPPSRSGMTLFMVCFGPTNVSFTPSSSLAHSHPSIQQPSVHPNRQRLPFRSSAERP